MINEQGRSAWTRVATSGHRSRRLGVATVLAIGLTQILAVVGGEAQGPPRASVSEDWTNRHVVFSAARTKGDSDRIARDPRYRNQWLRHNRPTQRTAENPAAAGVAMAAQTVNAFATQNARRQTPAPTPTNRDWGTSLGVGGTVGAGNFPAKFTFDINATPSCETDYVAFNTSLKTLDAVAASGTGTFTTAGQSGSITVNGVVLTASQGAAALMTTTVSSNGVVAGNTITVTNGASSQVYTASAPVAEVDRITFDATTADNNSYVDVANVRYVFKTSNWSSAPGTVPSNQCFVRASSTQSTMVTRLSEAITYGTASGGTPGTGTWQCSASQSTTAGANVSATGTSTIDLTAKTPGTTGFTTAESSGGGGNNRLSVTVTTAGSDGLTTSGRFPYWSGAAAASASTLAGNIRTAMTGSPVTGVTVSGSGSTVTLTASVAGTLGNSITVATTIPSGLTGGAFNGALSGGTAGTTDATHFKTSTDSATPLNDEAASLATAINANGTLAPLVTASSSGAVVTVTADAAGTAANSYNTTDALSGFAWGATTLTGGAAAVTPPNMVAFNQLYSGQTAAAAASQIGTFTGSTTADTSWIAIVNGATLIASPTANTSFNFQVVTNGSASTNASTNATNLANAINRNSGGVVIATSSAGVVTVTATSVGAAGNALALSTLNLNAGTFDWGGPTLTGGADGGATGLCNQTGPSMMWSYKTASSGGSASSSPVLSMDGKVIMYVETNAAGAALRILKWKAGQGTLVAPVAPDLPSLTSMTACPNDDSQSCLVSVPFNNAAAASNSAPFYDYGSDTIYVGDDTGRLHKITQVLNGTPIDVNTSGWPVVVSASALSSPVYDSVSGNVFVGDAAGGAHYVREVGSSVPASGGCTAPCAGPVQALGGKIVDAPIVDSSTHRVHFFNGNDSNRGSVHQFDTALTTASKKTVNIGTSSTSSIGSVHPGGFDNAYMTSTADQGHLFVCGKVSGSTTPDRPALFRLSFNPAGDISTTAGTGFALASTSSSECSPITEVYNNGVDRLFFSVGNNAITGISGCTSGGGCILSLNLTTLGNTWPPAASNFVGYSTPGVALTASNPGASTSGIVIDNVSPASQASSLYFTFIGPSAAGALCNGASGVGCAVKLTQAGLN